MLSFIALAWDRHSRPHSDSAVRLCRRLETRGGSWKCVTRTRGLVVYCHNEHDDEAEVHVLTAELGVILGVLFRRPSAGDEPRFSKVRSISGPESDRFVASKGHELVDSYWGRYVAFLVDANGDTSYALRSPLGSLPCFVTNAGGVTIYFSRADDLPGLQLPHFATNWDYVVTRIVTAAAYPSSSGLEGVYELQPGECERVHNGDSVRELYWQPHQIANDRTLSAEDAASSLNAVGKACVGAWASCHASLIHRLSGGLDSSIVAACLASSAQSSVTCVNYFQSHASATDERLYARLVADRCGFELIEQERSATAVTLDRLLNMGAWVNPFPHLAQLETGIWEAPIARRKRATAVFSGVGGDALFARYDKHLAVIDLAWDRGARAELLSFASRIAPLTPLSLWTILGGALRHGVLKRQRNEQESFDAPRLVSKDAAAMVPLDAAAEHSWLESSGRSLPPGKLMHIRHALYVRDQFYSPLTDANAPEEINPLRSQPFVELCLRIPTYLHLCDGRDRGLARRAFAADVPEQIRYRKWKGRAANFSRQVLIHNIDTAREMLLDGMLVQKKLLDRPALEATLSNNVAANSGYLLEVFDYLLIEAWLQGWARASSDWAPPTSAAATA